MHTPDDLQQSLEALLNRAGQAHGQYETTVLNGVYDQDWHHWYARWALEHGLNGHVRRAMDAEEWSNILYTINEAHRQIDGKLSWAAYTAQQILATYG